MSLLAQDDIGQAIIFTATKRSTEQLAETLNDNGFTARYLHGDLPQGKRNRIITDVKSGKCNFLIATDVAARGIDISTISHVVNYDLPRQVEDYVHRIGRCGRAGRTGVAMNLCSRDDQRQLGFINRYLKRDMKENVIEGLEPKFTPKNERKGDRKSGKFDKRPSDRFKRADRSDKSGDFYQKSRERAFSKFGKIDSPYEQLGKTAKDKKFDKGSDRMFDRCTDKGFDSGQRTDRRFDKPFDRNSDRPFDKKSDKRFDKADLYQNTARRKRDVSELDREYHTKQRGEGFKSEFKNRFESERMGDSFKKRSEHFDKSAKFKDDRPKRERFDKGFDKGFDKPRSDRFDRPKKKVVEEVFYDKRQAKKARKFGEL